jgi:hypothetical protein
VLTYFDHDISTKQAHQDSFMGKKENGFVVKGGRQVRFWFET